ncbi:hypothetical protein N9805_03505 [Paracoccaceae bacterium]|nr:hypothetical protein [Paracoccaceae bacterium]
MTADRAAAEARSAAFAHLDRSDILPPGGGCLLAHLSNHQRQLSGARMKPDFA